ncbi:MAG: hypothetical protein LUH09_09355 [Clostridiales bacterium]|nr:hypothetical protein [Clostridiales bacterium]
MRSVSDGFLAASGRYYARLVLADGTEVESADIVSLTLTAACNGATDRLTLGASPAASLTGTLAGSRSDLEGQKLTLWLGRTVSGVLEEYQMGVFTVTQATVSDGDTTTLLAYDANNVEMERTTYAPGSASTARAVLAEICTQAGLALGDTGTLADADVSGYSLEGFTCRAMAGYMAALLGGNAVIDAAGQLCVRWFGDADVSLGPDEYYSGGLSLAAKDWSLDTLTCSVTTTATETTTDEDGNTTTAETSNTETLAWGLGSTGVELSNPWMTQAQLALIGADIGGMSYRSGTVSCLGDLRIEAGDMVTVTDSSGNRYAVPAMELSLTYDGGLKASIAAYAQTESDGGGSGSSGPLAETVNSPKVTVANIQNLTAENLTATNAKISSLSANYASLETVVAGKADIDDLTAATARITDLEADAITTGTLAAAVAKLGYLETDSLSAAVAELGYLTASDAKLTYATIENLNAANLNITDLSADVANINTILAGNIGTGSLQTVHLTGENVVIDDAVITSAMIADLSASKLTAGTIYTDKVTIQSESGNLYITDNTIQIQDGTTVRVQIGEDASGDYNLYLWDAAGNLLWDAGGLYAAGIHDGIIRDIAVADDAAISGTKLGIASVASELNADGSLTVDAANITIDNTTLSAVYTTITQSIADIESDSVSAVTTYYALGESNTEPPSDPATGGDLADSTVGTAVVGTAVAVDWTAERLVADEGYYLWVAYCIQYVDGSIAWTTPVCLTDDYTRAKVSTLETELAVVQGQITAKVWQTDITDITDPLGEQVTTLNDQYAQLTLDLNSITLSVGDLTTTVTDQGTSITEITGELSLKVDKDDNEQIVSMINASANEICITGDRLVIESTNFTLTAEGKITCTDGEFSGKITATAGSIGGWLIDNYRLYAELTALKTTTETVYVTDDDGNYIPIQATDDDGNPLYYTDDTESETTTEETDYPVYETDEDGNVVYQTEEVEVTTSTGYDSYTILNALKSSSGNDIAISIGATDPDDLTTGAIRMYSNGYIYTPTMSFTDGIYPTKTDTYSLGSTAHRWNYVRSKYLNVGSITATSGAIYLKSAYSTNLYLYPYGSTEALRIVAYSTSQLQISSGLRVTGNIIGNSKVVAGTTAVYNDGVPGVQLESGGNIIQKSSGSPNIYFFPNGTTSNPIRLIASSSGLSLNNSFSVTGNGAFSGSLSTYGYTVPRMLTGTVSVSVTASTATTFSVTFSTTFPGTPYVFLSVSHNSSVTNLSYKVMTKSSTGFTGYIYSSGGGTHTVNWLATYTS